MPNGLYSTLNTCICFGVFKIVLCNITAITILVCVRWHSNVYCALKHQMNIQNDLIQYHTNWYLIQATPIRPWWFFNYCNIFKQALCLMHKHQLHVCSHSSFRFPGKMDYLSTEMAKRYTLLILPHPGLGTLLGTLTGSLLVTLVSELWLLTWLVIADTGNP